MPSSSAGCRASPNTPKGGASVKATWTFCRTMPPIWMRRSTATLAVKLSPVTLISVISSILGGFLPRNTSASIAVLPSVNSDPVSITAKLRSPSTLTCVRINCPLLRRAVTTISPSCCGAGWRESWMVTALASKSSMIR